LIFSKRTKKEHSKNIDKGVNMHFLFKVFDLILIRTSKKIVENAKCSQWSVSIMIFADSVNRSSNNYVDRYLFEIFVRNILEGD